MLASGFSSRSKVLYNPKIDELIGEPVWDPSLTDWHINGISLSVVSAIDFENSDHKANRFY